MLFAGTRPPARLPRAPAPLRSFAKTAHSAGAEAAVLAKVRGGRAGPPVIWPAGLPLRSPDQLRYLRTAGLSGGEGDPATAGEEEQAATDREQHHRAERDRAGGGTGNRQLVVLVVVLLAALTVVLVALQVLGVPGHVGGLQDDLLVTLVTVDDLGDLDGDGETLHGDEAVGVGLSLAERTQRTDRLARADLLLVDELRVLGLFQEAVLVRVRVQ